MKIFCLPFIISLFCFKNSNCQKTIEGSVKDSLKKNIVNAAVTIKLYPSKSIIAYTYTNEFGLFKIKISEKYANSNLILSVNSLNFEPFEEVLE